MCPIRHDAVLQDRGGIDGSRESWPIFYQALLIFDDLGVPTDQIARYFKVSSSDILALREKCAARLDAMPAISFKLEEISERRLSAFEKLTREHEAADLPAGEHERARIYSLARRSQLARSLRASAIQTAP